MAEVIGTFTIVNIIISIKYLNGATDLVINALAIGVTYMLSIVTIGGQTGGALNPAIGLVQSIFQLLMIRSFPNTIALRKKATLQTMWIYIIAPFVGGILSGLFQKFNKFAQDKLKQSAKEV